MPLLTRRRQTDDQLMVRVQADDIDAFGLLYDRHSDRAFSVARTLCHSEMEAEQVFQAAFLEIWRDRASYQPGSGFFQAWSVQVVRAIADVDLPADAAPGRSQKMLQTTIDRLPEVQSEIITLAYFGGLSHSEIAEYLDLPDGSVKGRMRLGLEELRGDLELPERQREPASQTSLRI